MKHMKSVAAGIVVVSALGAAAGVLAQTAQPAPAPNVGQQQAPSEKGEMQGMQGMMGMMNMMSQMDPAQMKQMMENCNKMMEGRVSPSQPSGADPRKG